MNAYADLAGKIQNMLRPYHVMPAINCLLALDWINAGLDGDTQILPVMAEIIDRKKRAGQPVPTSLKYYDTVIKGLNKSPEPNAINESEMERDLRLAKVYRWKIETLKGKDWLKEERALADLEQKHGPGFGLNEKPSTVSENREGLNGR